MKGICRPLRKDAILPPLLAGVLIRLDGVLNVAVDDDVAVDAAAFAAAVLLYDPPGVF